MSRVSFVVVLLVTVGCGDDSAPPPVPRDGGSRDASSFDADTPVDAGPSDADLGRDVPIFVPPDAGPQDAAATDPCADDPGDDRCAAGCGAGYVCVDDLCGGRACVPGRACATADDCGGRSCDESGRCVPSTSGCTSELECPVGYRCETGSCIDRRVPCGIVSPFGCPRGYACTFDTVFGRLFCVPSMPRCASAVNCPLGNSCTDVDGDGARECLPSGECATSDACDGANLCTVDPMAAIAVCDVDGACRDGGCTGGRTCIDPTGNGAPRCWLPGDCAADTDCPERHVCAAPNVGDSLRCIGLDGDDT